MNKNLQNDLNNTKNLIEIAAQQGTSFLANINNALTSSNANPKINEFLNDEGLGAEKTLALFNQQFIESIVGSTGPRYWGYVIGGATPASIMGDMLATFYDQNTQGTKGQGDISAQIELETIKLLLDLFELPNDYLGGFVTGATISNFTCLAVARQWLGKQKNIDIAKEGVPKGIKILSALPHSSSIKSLSMLGLGSNNIITVKTAEGNREAIDITDLQYKINALNNEPFILIASAGTVNTVDFDDFAEIAQLKNKHNFWLHIDGAFGAFAKLSAEHKHLLNGWEIADSITIDCHKWLNVPYENAFFLVKEKHKILQTETFQNSNAPYLGDPMENFSYLNFLPENSRRLKALPVWFTLNAYGKKGYQQIVEDSIKMATLFGTYIEQSTWLTLLAPVRLNNVAFTLSGSENQAKVASFLNTLNSTGKVFMTPTIYNKQVGIRAAFVNWRTTEADIKIVIEEMERLRI